MYIMFKKINTKQRVIGWYSTGPKLKASDLAIHELYRPYCGGQDPILVLLDVQPRAVSLELPMVAYRSMQEATSNKMFKRAFYHVPSLVGASEPEEVGVEHLLRDIRNASASTLATKVADKLTSLRTLVSKLKEIADYLSQVAMGKLPENTQIIYNLQNIFNLLPEGTPQFDNFIFTFFDGPTQSLANMNFVFLSRRIVIGLKVVLFFIHSNFRCKSTQINYIYNFC